MQNYASPLTLSGLKCENDTRTRSKTNRRGLPFESNGFPLIGARGSLVEGTADIIMESWRG